MMVFSSTDLPVPEPPTTPSTSAALDIQVQPVMDRLRAEPGDQSAHADHGQLLQTPTYENRIEKRASSTITRNIPTTTDRVVSRPTLSALPLTFSPS